MLLVALAAAVTACVTRARVAPEQGGRDPITGAVYPANGGLPLSDAPDMLALARAAGQVFQTAMRFHGPPPVVYPAFCGPFLAPVHWTRAQLEAQKRLAGEFAAGVGGPLLDTMQKAPAGRTPVQLIAVGASGDAGSVKLRFSASYPGGFGIDEFLFTFTRSGDGWTYINHRASGFTDLEDVAQSALPVPAPPPPPPGSC